MIPFLKRKTLTTETSTILRRVAEKDTSALKDCIDAYGDLIWALSRKLTGSTEKAETVTEEIFTDIWRYCDRPRNTQSTEKELIVMIALRRLMKPLQFANQRSMARLEAQKDQGVGTDRFSEFI